MIDECIMNPTQWNFAQLLFAHYTIQVKLIYCNGYRDIYVISGIKNHVCLLTKRIRIRIEVQDFGTRICVAQSKEKTGSHEKFGFSGSHDRPITPYIAFT